jgi:hypothetical protein
VPVGPSTLDEEVPQARVAHFGDRAAPHRLPGGTLAGHQADIRHEPAWALEPRDVANLHHERHRRHELDTTERLECLDNRGKAPAWQEFFDRLLDPPSALLAETDVLEQLLEYDLVGRVLKTLLLQPAAVPSTPVLLAREEPAVTQQEGADLALLRAYVSRRRGPRPD